LWRHPAEARGREVCQRPELALTLKKIRVDDPDGEPVEREVEKTTCAAGLRLGAKSTSLAASGAGLLVNRLTGLL
jgi:hypothetical protein